VLILPVCPFSPSRSLTHSSHSLQAPLCPPSAFRWTTNRCERVGESTDLERARARTALSSSLAPSSNHLVSLFVPPSPCHPPSHVFRGREWPRCGESADLGRIPSPPHPSVSNETTTIRSRESRAIVSPDADAPSALSLSSRGTKRSVKGYATLGARVTRRMPRDLWSSSDRRKARYHLSRSLGHRTPMIITISITKTLRTRIHERASPVQRCIGL